MILSHKQFTSVNVKQPIKALYPSMYNANSVNFLPTPYSNGGYMCLNNNDLLVRLGTYTLITRYSKNALLSLYFKTFEQYIRRYIVVITNYEIFFY